MSLQDYEFLEKLGSGSFGVVHKVRKKDSKQIEVIKQIDLSRQSNAMKEDAKREAQLLSDLHNPYIVKYYCSFLDKQYLNIVMEYCENGDLSMLIKKQHGKYLLESTIWKYFTEIALALLYLHKRRILHRDIKTMNIFMSKDGHCKLGDLGVAKVLSDTTNFAHTIVGTPYYLSPELCQEKPYNFKSDVWALGVVLYEMCALRYPFVSKNQFDLAMKIMQGKFDKLPSLYSKDLSDIITNCMIKDYKKRPSIFQLLSFAPLQQKAHQIGIEVPSTEHLMNVVQHADVPDHKPKTPLPKGAQTKKTIQKPKEPPKIKDKVIVKEQNKIQHKDYKSNIELLSPMPIEAIEAKVVAQFQPIIDKYKSKEEKPKENNVKPTEKQKTDKIVKPQNKSKIEGSSKKKLNKHHLKNIGRDPFNEFQFHSDLDHPQKLPDVICHSKGQQSEKKYQISDINKKIEKPQIPFPEKVIPLVVKELPKNVIQEIKASNGANKNLANIISIQKPEEPTQNDITKSTNVDILEQTPVPIVKENKPNIAINQQVQPTWHISNTIHQQKKEEEFKINEISPVQCQNPDMEQTTHELKSKGTKEESDGTDYAGEDDVEYNSEEEKITESNESQSLMKELQKDLEDLKGVAESLKNNCKLSLGNDEFEKMYLKVKNAWSEDKELKVDGINELLGYNLCRLVMIEADIGHISEKMSEVTTDICK